jgi:electron transfer flavoprotein beta subunit
VDAGLETIEVDLPAVITSDLRLNEPRYIKLPEIMKAKKKPLAVTEIGALGVTPAQQHKVLKTEAPAQRSRGAMVKDTAELVAALRKIGVVA